MVYNNQVYSSFKPQNAVNISTNNSSKHTSFFEKIREFFEAIASFFCCYADRKSNKKFEAENLTHATKEAKVASVVNDKIRSRTNDVEKRTTSAEQKETMKVNTIVNNNIAITGTIDNNDAAIIEKRNTSAEQKEITKVNTIDNNDVAVSGTLTTEFIFDRLQIIFKPLQSRDINTQRKINEVKIKQFSKQLSESIHALEMTFKTPQTNRDDQELDLIPAGRVPGIHMRFFVSPATGDIFIPFKKNAHFQDKIPLIGAGSFKKVRLAWDVKNKQVVVLWRMLLNNNNAKKSFDIEQKFAKIFKGSAHIAQSNYSISYNNKKGEKVAAGVSPYYPHGDLLTLSQSRLSPSQEHQLWLQILTGLKTVHSKGVVHRDIKPENIFIGDNYDAQIADFGLAEEVAKLGFDGPGTPEYYPPEVIENLNWKVANPQLGDNYALGITILVYYLAKSTNQKAKKIWGKCRQQVFTNLHTLGNARTFQELANSKEKIKNKDEYIEPILKKLETTIPEHMITLIKDLTKINPAERMTLDQALEIMENVN